jgi:hypothetical protein
MSNKGIYSAPIEMLVDADIVNEVIEQLKPALVAIEEHHQSDEEDVYREMIIGTSAVMAGLAASSGMDIDVLLSIVRQSYFDVMDRLHGGDEEGGGDDGGDDASSAPPSTNKNNIN